MGKSRRASTEIGLCKSHLRTLKRYTECPTVLLNLIVSHLTPMWAGFDGLGEDLPGFFAKVNNEARGCGICYLTELEQPFAVQQTTMFFYHFANNLTPFEALKIDDFHRPITVFHVEGLVMPMVTLEVSAETLEDYGQYFPPQGGWN